LTAARATGTSGRRARTPAPRWSRSCCRGCRSAALWTDPSAASPAGFADAAEYEEFTVTGRQDDLAGIPVRIDCGTDDPFYADNQEYVDGFPAGSDLTVTFEPGAHQAGYWRRMLPVELEFLGGRLAG
jgi:hypothetical protein